MRSKFLHPVERLEDVVSDTLCGQSWAAKASVIFYWSVCALSRAEWRYGPYAYAPLLVDGRGMWAKISISPARRRPRHLRPARLPP